MPVVDPIDGSQRPDQLLRKTKKTDRSRPNHWPTSMGRSFKAVYCTHIDCFTCDGREPGSVICLVGMGVDSAHGCGRSRKKLTKRRKAGFALTGMAE
jgi:hypothetical protein